MSQPLIRESVRLPLAFFASGAAALLFEVLWFRALGRVLGNTVWAGALVLTAFMLGIALGGILAARWAQRIQHPARAFAAAEITVALSGSLLAWGLPALESTIGQFLSPLAEHPATLASAAFAAGACGNAGSDYRDGCDLAARRARSGQTEYDSSSGHLVCRQHLRGLCSAAYRRIPFDRCAGAARNGAGRRDSERARREPGLAAAADPLAVRALAERDYAQAAKLFGQAAGQNPRQAGALAAYAMCRSGRRDRAAAVPGADLLAQDLRCWPGTR
jgi:hypothetical protein